MKNTLITLAAIITAVSIGIAHAQNPPPRTSGEGDKIIREMGQQSQTVGVMPTRENKPNITSIRVANTHTNTEPSKDKLNPETGGDDVRLQREDVDHSTVLIACISIVVGFSVWMLWMDRHKIRDFIKVLRGK